MFDFLKKKKKKDRSTVIYSISDGTIVDLKEVPDEVFANKMMGDGFAIQPQNGSVYSPVTGTVKTVFPTKHALGLTTDEGIDVLIHLGVDTVELNGEPFDLFVNVGDQVTPETKLVEINLDELTKAGKDSSLMLIFTNGDKIKQMDIHYGPTKSQSEAGNLTLND